MERLAFLKSPYIQELPLHLLPRSYMPRDLQETGRLLALLLDVMRQDVYLVDREIVRMEPQPEHSEDSVRAAYRVNQYVGIEVEINTHCNLRCVFCPVSLNPHPVRMMQMEDFKHIVIEALSCGIREISLNHYSEPTLNPNLEQMIKHAAERHLDVTLFTNGTCLTPTLVEGIEPYADRIVIVVNVPEGDSNLYHHTTGSRLFHRVQSNISFAAQRLNVKVVVNNSDDKTVKRLSNLLGVSDVETWRTDDRAGAITLPGVPSRYHDGALNGCPLAIRYINVSVDGDVFLCAQDFWKSHVLGNVHVDSLRSILDCDMAWQYRRWVFGIELAPNEWLCRRCSWTRERDVPFSIGAHLSEVDLAVYGEIVKRAPPTIVLRSENGVGIVKRPSQQANDVG